MSEEDTALLASSSSSSIITRIDDFMWDGDELHSIALRRDGSIAFCGRNVED